MQSYQLKGSLSSKGEDSFPAGRFSFYNLLFFKQIILARKLIHAEKKRVEKRGGGGGKQSLIVVCLGFQNPSPLYTTHARSMHLPYEKSNRFPQKNLILSINPYQKATRPIWTPGMMFFLNPFLNEEFGNGFSLIPQPEFKHHGLLAVWTYLRIACSVRLFNREYSSHTPSTYHTA